MTDAEQLKLVERLRRRAAEYNDRGGSYFYIGDDCALDDLAADTIQRLCRPNPSGDADVREAAVGRLSALLSVDHLRGDSPVPGLGAVSWNDLRAILALTGNASTDRAGIDVVDEPRVSELVDATTQLLRAVNFCEPTERLAELTEAEGRARTARNALNKDGGAGW